MKMQTKLSVNDFMNTHVQTIGLEMHLKDIIAFLLTHKLSKAPVIKRKGNSRILLGFVSEAESLEHVSNELFYGFPSPIQTAGMIMKRDPACVDPEIDIFTLASIFTSHYYRHLPVVQDHVLLGIVSRRDVLQALDTDYQEWSRLKDDERFTIDTHEIINHRFISKSIGVEGPAESLCDFRYVLGWRVSSMDVVR